ncbi:uncharacterized protein LOC108673158 [Hyalella azteca]|uniref:Uncharacterized protein LOC108673158 n=1 Tax=Hyalella azteca TaxID=294128 RepID=A0A8B7NRR6_HYAAZ|nr:uncharacterized protein LOC108673158 [Hyalella azteca]
MACSTWTNTPEARKMNIDLPRRSYKHSSSTCLPTHDLPSHRCHDLPSHCGSDLPSHRCHDLLSHRCHDLPSHRCHDHREKMTRALMILIAAAAASSAAGASPCKTAMKEAYESINRNIHACYEQHRTEMDKFLSNIKCVSFTSLTGYDAATCDPLVSNFSKCSLQAVGLLKDDNTFDDEAFQTTTLNNKCSTDPNFSNAYSNCKTSTMKHLNINRLFVCLNAAVP